MAQIAALLGTLLAASAVHGYTIVNSDFLMRKNIDPIVMPGQYKSHMHSFFGSDAVTANTTRSEELRAGCHTNDNPNDYSVYWTPTLFAVKGDERIPIEPRYFKAYYIGIESAEIPYPEDFKTVAGNASAKSQADVDELTGVQWFCEYGPAKAEGADVAAFPTTGCDIGRLQSLLLFHDCVNPDTLESAYSGRHNLPRVNRCPEGMVRIPQLRFSVRFDTTDVLPDGWSGEAPLQLASGPSYSWHGDFINGWLPEAAKNMLLQAGGKRDFHAVTGPLDKQPACKPKDSDPDNGTGDYKESLLSFQNQAQPAVAASSSPSSTAAAAAAAAAAATTSAVSSSPTFTTLVAPAQPTTTSVSDAAATSSPAATGCKRAKRARRATRDA